LKPLPTLIASSFLFTQFPRKTLMLLLTLSLVLNTACSSGGLPEPRVQASTTQADKLQEKSSAVAVVVKTQKANIRNAPSKSAIVLATVNKNDLLSLVTPASTGAWYQVRDSRTGQQGWIHGNTIALLQTIPSNTSAPQTQTSIERPRTTSLPATGRSYVNVDGVRVPSPVFSETKPAGATARCRDGSYSFSQHRRGTCSHHGGVAEWF
jgi:SH3-like domain-containing protein